MQIVDIVRGGASIFFLFSLEPNVAAGIKEASEILLLLLLI